MPEKERSDNDLAVWIQTTQGTWEEATFPKTTKVQEVIQATTQHFGFAANGSYELYLESDRNNPLKSERTLVSYDIKDSDVLVFTDLGVAV